MVIYIHRGMYYDEGENMLEDLEEPRDLKTYFVNLLQENEELAKAAIKQSSWLAKYIWDRKREILKRKRITWQMLMSAVRNSYPLTLSWILNKFSWKDLLEFIEKQLEQMIVIYT